MEHVHTGATFIHLKRQDPDNCFCISFRTPPTYDTGSPHILEHIVLSGSEKYPG